MQSMRVAILGTGGIAEAHIRALRQIDKPVEVVAAADVDAQRAEAFCAKHGIPHSYGDAATMLSAIAPDLVHICTPSDTHAALTIQCLGAGAWVLCEKPLCVSLAESDAIEATEQKTGRYASSVFQQRFGSGAQHLKRLVEDGEMGRPLVGLCQTLWYRDETYYRVPWRAKWATSAGGATTTLGIHVIDLCLWLLGDWVQVRATMDTLDRRGLEVENVSMGEVRFENDAIVSIVNSALSPRQETYLRLDFQKATVELKYLYRYANQDWHYSIPDGAPYQNDLARWQMISGDIPSGHAAQLDVLLDHLLRGERPPADAIDARRTLEFVTSFYKSAVTGQVVTRGSIRQDDPFYHSIIGSQGQSLKEELN